jgi:hypothetical protein
MGCIDAHAEPARHAQHASCGTGPRGGAYTLSVWQFIDDAWLCLGSGVLGFAKAPDRLGGPALHGGYALIPCGMDYLKERFFSKLTTEKVLVFGFW